MDKLELKKRTYQFGRRCLRLCEALPNTKIGRHIEGQLIRCSTSVSANYRAALLAQSSAAFVAKLSIVIEEADESAMWLELVIDEELLEKDKVNPLLKEAEELTAIFVSSRKTLNTKPNNK
ncbi:MAG TPA: four helix bundle protein [Prolixibacteraceae bacterium]|nr:four helix bundle protein [Prolixibacteraceae bacterium]HPS12568.1 four helix bundle protein [Prolixibacteraceae bacterium]